MRRIAVVVTIVATVVVGFGGAAAADHELACSVRRVSGGVELRWNAVDDATAYQYRLSLPDRPNKYVRVTGTSAVIPVEPGLRAKVSLGPVFADGSTHRRSNCGQQVASDFTCSVSAAANGVRVDWSPVADARAYRYQLEVDGVRSYGEVVGSNATLGDGSSLTSVSMTPVLADGSTGPRTFCGSAGRAGMDCEVHTTGGGIALAWQPVEGAIDYQYKLEVAGTPNRYVRTGTAGVSTVVELSAGTLAKVGLAPIFADGSTQPRTICGTTAAG